MLSAQRLFFLSQRILFKLCTEHGSYCCAVYNVQSCYHCCAEYIMLSLLCWIYHVIIVVLNISCYHCCAEYIMLSLLCWIYHVIIVVLNISCYPCFAEYIMLSLLCWIYHVIIVVLDISCYPCCAEYITLSLLCSVFTLLYNQWGAPPHNFCWPPRWILSKLPPRCYLYPTDG